MVNLPEILAATRRRLARCRSKADLRELERLAQLHQPRGFLKALERSSASGVAVVAELKRASPSRGLIRTEFEPAGLARDFERAGAAALSVLTDQEFFQGSLEDLRLASKNTGLPCLRKDFLVDEFQILEARANSADALLLIVSALSESELTGFARRAAELELDALVEVHNEEELERALAIGATLIGVNNRDLRTFRVDRATALRLAKRIPRDVLAVAESGIESGADVARLRAAGYRAFLIGETLMRAPVPQHALSALLSEAACAV